MDTHNSNQETIQGIVLGVDYGMKKMGFAIADTVTCTVNPQEVIGFSSFEQSLTLMIKKIEEWRAVAVILGLPLDKDGSEQKMTYKVQHFATSLKPRINCPIFFSDERYTTKVAQQMLRDVNNKSTQLADNWAAGLILQCWLNQNISLNN